MEHAEGTVVSVSGSQAVAPGVNDSAKRVFDDRRKIRRRAFRIAISGLVLGLVGFVSSIFFARALLLRVVKVEGELAYERLARRALQAELEEVRLAVPFPTFDDLKLRMQKEFGIIGPELLRKHKDSFVELYSYDDRNMSNYGTAGYLGNGYFITVKHGVIALGQGGSSGRKITSVKISYKGRLLPATLVDYGDAKVEVDAGDWAIIRVKDDLELPALTVAVDYQFEFADPIFRLGNDYSKGIIPATGFVGQRTENRLVTCLTDGHPGVSGGGVLNLEGELVGIPVGRMQGDFRFSFILPLRQEMFQKVPHLRVPPA